MSVSTFVLVESAPELDVPALGGLELLEVGHLESPLAYLFLGGDFLLENHGEELLLHDEV